MSRSMRAGRDLRRAIESTLAARGGVVFAQPALVGRAMYTGRDILARNSRMAPGYQDARGYVPVERWILSLTEAANERPIPGEGISRLLVDGEPVWLTKAAEAAGDLLFGPYLDRWPLTKVLDIGGDPVTPDFGPLSGMVEGVGEPEVPPIPFHVHSGTVVNGRLHGPGKLEAYFFPPVDVPPYRAHLGRVITRLGLRPGTTREQVLTALREFGRSDAMYALGSVYEIHPYDGWTVEPGTLHAPGPWPTFEIQLPQDDNNFASWRLGARASGEDLEQLRADMMLKGLAGEEDFLEQAVDWDGSTRQDFEARHRRRSRLLEEGPWGRRLQIFFDAFYGEALEVRPGQRVVRAASAEPWGAIVWSGQGRVNGAEVAPYAGGEASAGRPSEWLVAPGHAVEVEAEGQGTLAIYSVFPVRR